MQAAQKRDAAHTEKFHFRRHLSAVTPDGVADPDEFELMDLNTIINGQVHARRALRHCCRIATSSKESVL
jgi:hypothetical protein